MPYKETALNELLDSQIELLKKSELEARWLLTRLSEFRVKYKSLKGHSMGANNALSAAESAIERALHQMQAMHPAKKDRRKKENKKEEINP